MTHSQYKKLERVCIDHELALPDGTYRADFWNLLLCNEDGGPVDWEYATQACFEVCDFDNEHDFDWLRARMREAGIQLPGTELEFSGDGEHGPIYGWNIPLQK